MTIPVPPTTADINTGASYLNLNTYGTVTAIEFHDGGPRIDVTLDNGVPLTVCPHLDTWMITQTGSEDDVDIEALHTLVDDSVDAEEVYDALGDLWDLVGRVIDQITRDVVNATGQALTDAVNAATGGTTA